jgi:hypothetical protein
MMFISEILMNLYSTKSFKDYSYLMITHVERGEIVWLKKNNRNIKNLEIPTIHAAFNPENSLIMLLVTKQ